MITEPRGSKVAAQLKVAAHESWSVQIPDAYEHVSRFKWGLGKPDAADKPFRGEKSMSWSQGKTPVPERWSKYAPSR